MNEPFVPNELRYKIDMDGSPISLVRISEDTAYSDIYTLLQSYINDNDQGAWEKLKQKIDYLYENMTLLLDALNHETHFKEQVLSELSKGKKLLFKANGVSVDVIDEITHGAGPGAPICSHWLFVAAIMRYFHDNLDISYYKMMFGEASTTAEILTRQYSLAAGRHISKESALEGRNKDFYGGFGFYFARKYLAERQPLDHTDNPMNGYENSVNEEYMTPGRANDRLMLYDLNNIVSFDRGRTVKVPDGGVYKEITIHKVVIGGSPSEKEDYPGCVLINLPILKMHAQDLLTNAVKNLGIGLYPSYCFNEDSNTFKYSHHSNFKSKLPHSPWVMELDPDTLLPVTDENGNYIRTKTLGFNGTQCDIVRSIQKQGILIINVSDAINIMNISHNPDGASIPTPEGFMFASLDPLALDYCCARYCFNQLPIMTGKSLMKENNWPTEFVHLVPLPCIEDNNIVTKTGYDSPLFRYDFYEYAKKRGIGNLAYYVTGFDTLTSTPIISVDGHLGRVEEDTFEDLLTDTMYYNPSTLLHHLQLTVLSYLKCCDQLTGTSLYDEIMCLYDENKDGIIDYTEKGRGFDNAQLAYLSKLYDGGWSLLDKLKRGALIIRYYLKYSDKNWNKEHIDFIKDNLLINIVNQAYSLSKSDGLHEDLFIPDMYFGDGQWPSWQTASYIYCTGALYGSYMIKDITLSSVYGSAFQYADIMYNDSHYTKGKDGNVTNPAAINEYFADVAQSKKMLPFTLYVPKDWSTLEGQEIPNVIETTDCSKLFTVLFKEVW